jgi:hypothetical protein
VQRIIFFTETEKNLIAVASLTKMVKSVTRTLNPDCLESGQKNGEEESKKQDDQGRVVEERREFAQKTLSQQPYGGDCGQAWEGDGRRQEESLQDGTSQVEKVHEVPR